MGRGFVLGSRRHGGELQGEKGRYRNVGRAMVCSSLASMVVHVGGSSAAAAGHGSVVEL